LKAADFMPYDRHRKKAAFVQEKTMKRFAVVLSIFSVFFLTVGAFALDKGTISTNVDSIVAGIDSGKDVMGIESQAYEPYAFIMQQDGQLIVHPTLAGKSLKEAAPPAYEALKDIGPDGVWVTYEWNGKEKNTYAKKTQNNLIVGSGY